MNVKCYSQQKYSFVYSQRSEWGAALTYSSLVTTLSKEYVLIKIDEYKFLGYNVMFTPLLCISTSE